MGLRSSESSRSEQKFRPRYYDTPGEINPGGANIQGKMFMGLAITQLLICADFIIYWVKSLLEGDSSVTLPEV